MRNREDIEAYLVRSNHPYREITEGTWIVGDSTGTRENIVVRIEDGLCLFRMKVLDIASIDPAKSAKFFQSLLELNSGDMVHGAYGIADGMVLMTSSLLLENLDYNEFVGVIEELVLATGNHHERLGAFRKN